MRHLKLDSIGFSKLMALAAVTMIVFPGQAFADDDPHFETPIQFLLNEQARRDQQQAHPTAAAVQRQPRVEQAGGDRPLYRADDADSTSRPTKLWKLKGLNTLAPDSDATPAQAEVKPSIVHSKMKNIPRVSEPAPAEATVTEPKPSIVHSKMKDIPRVSEPAPAQATVQEDPKPSIVHSKMKEISRLSESHATDLSSEAALTPPTPPSPAQATVSEPKPSIVHSKMKSIPRIDNPELAEAPAADQPAPAPKPSIVHSKMKSIPRVSEDAPDGASLPQPVPAEKPSIVHSKMKGSLLRPSDATVAPSADTHQATALMPVDPQAQTSCDTPSMSPGTGVTQTAKFSKSVQQTLAQADKDPDWDTVRPSLIFGPEDEKNVDDYKDLGRNPKEVMTPAKKDPALKSMSAQVRKVLKAAKEEANRTCRFISGHQICRKGSKRACLQGVRMAFQRAFGQSTASGWVLNAKDAGPSLKKYGWQKAASGKYNEYNAPVGAVLIYDVPGNPRLAGHIEIKGDDGYYSDFFAKNPVSSHLPRRLIGVYIPPQN